jgi:hypothetical protein
MQKYAPGSFSYNGLEILFDYLTDLENDIGDEIEFDPVSFRSDYSESAVADIISDYLIDIQDGLSESELLEKIIQVLNDDTIVLGITHQGTIVYKNF